MNGTFSSPLMIFIGLNSNLKQIGFADFNIDQYLDIGAMPTRSLHIYTFLSDTRRDFQLIHRIQYLLFDMSVGDYDKSNQPDIIVLVHEWRNTGYILHLSLIHI